MRIKKNITLFLLLALAMSMLVAKNTDDTYYKRYKSIDLNSNFIEGITSTAYGVSLPIIASYDPNVKENFLVTSESNANVGLYFDSNPVTYNTADYDITSVGESESFIISYINNLDKTDNRIVDIFYDQQFYSIDGRKQTGIFIDLEYDNIISDDKISLYNKNSGLSWSWINGNNNQSFKYDYFLFQIGAGYHKAPLIKFKFTWIPKTLDQINEYSSNYNNKVFNTGEKVLAFVLIQIDAS